MILMAKEPSSMFHKVRTHGSSCTSRQSTTRNKPNTTHAPLRTSSPKPSQLEATRSAHRPSKQPKAKTAPECTERCENQEPGQSLAAMHHFLPMYSRQRNECLNMPRATRPNNSETTYDVVESEIKARGLAKSRAHRHRIKSLKETSSSS